MYTGQSRPEYILLINSVFNHTFYTPTHFTKEQQAGYDKHKAIVLVKNQLFKKNKDNPHS